MPETLCLGAYTYSTPVDFPQAGEVLRWCHPHRTDENTVRGTVILATSVQVCVLNYVIIASRVKRTHLTCYKKRWRYQSKHLTIISANPFILNIFLSCFVFFKCISLNYKLREETCIKTKLFSKFYYGFMHFSMKNDTNSVVSPCMLSGLQYLPPFSFVS